MADPTTNFGWDLPTDGGSTATWGAELNGIFQDIDDDLQTVKDTADDAAADATSALAQIAVVGASLLEQPYIPARMGIAAPITWGASPNWRLNGTSPECDVSLNLDPFLIPLAHLRVGVRITGFASFGVAVGGDAACTASLCYVDSTNTINVVSAGHAIGGATGSLTHDVLADMAYYIQLTPTGATGIVLAYGVQLTVIVSP